MKNGEAICFTNKMKNRFRLILRMSNMNFMAIPETDEGSKLSIYLRVSEELARLAGVTQPRIELGRLADITNKRLERRAALKRTRMKRNKNGTKSKRTRN